MKILAIDTSTEAMSVALYDQGQVIQRFQHQPQQQAKLLLPETQALLADVGISLSQVDAIAYCHGPGSFTGLRVAVAAAQGMAIAADKPLISVSTLLTLAYGEYRRSQQAEIMACLDARMQEVYFAAYQFNQNHYMVLHEDVVQAPAQVKLATTGPINMVGNGWSVYRDQFTFPVPDTVFENIHWPEAGDLARLAAVKYKEGKLLTPEQALPVYIRDNVAEKPKPLIK